MDLIMLIVEALIIVYLASATMLLIRVIRGPTLFDRVAAVDALSYDLTVFMALLALYTGRLLVATPMILISLWAYALDIYVLKFTEYGEMGE
ncbi:MAG: monovalent cation/H+ antiporter complex subunit F [Desulfurococcaceae archaeon]